MHIIGFMGSPSSRGKCSRLLQKALAGAQSRGATIAYYNLVDCNIMNCRGCGTCFKKHPELEIGKCPLQDDMAGILAEYVRADGFVFASPVYDVYVSSIMKKFLERKIALTYKAPERRGKLPVPRKPAGYKKKASYIVTGDALDEYREIMGDPCFEAMSMHHLLEEVEPLDKMYAGNAEHQTREEFDAWEQKAFALGVRLVEEIAKAQDT